MEATRLVPLRVNRLSAHPSSQRRVVAIQVARREAPRRLVSPRRLAVYLQRSGSRTRIAQSGPKFRDDLSGHLALNSSARARGHEQFVGRCCIDGTTEAELHRAQSRRSQEEVGK